MKQTQLHAALLIAAVAIAAFALGKSQSGAARAIANEDANFDVLSALPRAASLALTVDFEREGAEPLENLLLRRGRELPDVGLLKDACGYDPTSEIRQLGVALIAPAARGEEPAVAVATRGVFDTNRVADCARKLVKRRGGKPTTTHSRGFQSIGGGPKSMARIAVRPDGLVLLGEARYLDRMLASAQGEQPSLADHKSHRRLRLEVDAQAPVLLSVVLESGWLARYLPDEDAEGSPIAAVRGAALSLSFVNDATLTARIECTTDDACTRLAGLCRKLWSSIEPALVRLAGAATTERAKLEVVDRALSFSWQLAPQALEDLLFQWPLIERAAHGLAPPAPGPTPEPSQPFVPDGVIEAAPPATGLATGRP
jgi:hypothetical protein